MMRRRCVQSVGRPCRAHPKLVLVAWTLAILPGVAVAFSPARQFPDTTDGIYVFVDQLNIASYTPAQLQFAASHYVGTQKQVSRRIDELRVYNNDFIMIQYRLGVRESGHEANYIHDDTWSNDWDSIDPHEDWFIHDDQGNRVYQLYGSSLEEYCMDVSGRINGNTTAGWKEYWASCVIADCDASHADGVFADSTHLPYAVPSWLQDSPIGGPPHVAYIEHMEDFYDYVYAQFDQANKYFIPNIGGLCTTADTTQGYYEDVHGAMVEGFAETRWGTTDWVMQQDRTLKLLGNDKIYIAQNGFDDHTKVDKRKWFLSNFLLLKHSKSYINMFSGADGQLYWWPEYDLDLGQELDTTVPEHVDDLKDPASGIYVRRYQRGLVLVNATDQVRTFTLDPGDPNLLVEPWGGGAIGGDGQMVRPAGLDYFPQGGSITLGAWSGAILVPEPMTLGLLGVAGLALLRRRRRR